MRGLLGPPYELPAQPSPKLKISPLLYQAYRATAQFISPDGQTIQFFTVLKAGAGGSTAAMNAIPATRTELTKVANSIGASQSGVLSLDAFSYDISSSSNSDMAHIIPIVLLVIALLLAIMLRSLVAPWYLVLTVGLSYLAALGFAMIVFVHLGGNSGLFFILPFLMFIFSMALGEDYNILVMSRIREEAHEANTLPEAVIKAIGVTGNTVTSAGIILAGTFAILGTIGGNNSGDELQEIGYSVAFGILLDTFFVRTLLVPSIALLLGRWNWWPSRLAYHNSTPSAAVASEPIVEPEPTHEEPSESEAGPAQGATQPTPPKPTPRPRRPRQLG
jgi:RND superfamily putative drug exporter